MREMMRQAKRNKGNKKSHSRGDFSAEKALDVSAVPYFLVSGTGDKPKN